MIPIRKTRKATGDTGRSRGLLREPQEDHSRCPGARILKDERHACRIHASKDSKKERKKPPKKRKGAKRLEGRGMMRAREYDVAIIAAFIPTYRRSVWNNLEGTS